jgi:hypothetical protein
MSAASSAPKALSRPVLIAHFELPDKTRFKAYIDSKAKAGVSELLSVGICLSLFDKTQLELPVFHESKTVMLTRLFAVMTLTQPVAIRYKPARNAIVVTWLSSMPVGYDRRKIIDDPTLGTGVFSRKTKAYDVYFKQTVGCDVYHPIGASPARSH